MTFAQGLSFALIGLMLALFLWDRWRFDLVALLILLLAVAGGIIPMDKAFDGFKNPLLPLIASALVLSAAVRNSGVVESALRRLRPLLQSRHAQVTALTSAVALLSALVKNIGALAIFLPVAMQVARRANRPVSELLMPMSFASLLGGMMTLIGTSPNLIVSTVRRELTGQPYAMFDFLPVGAGLTVVAVAFLSVGWRLLPRRRAQAADAPFRMEDYIGEAKLPKDSNLVGKTVGELEALADHEVEVNAIIRQGDRRYIPAAHWRLYPDDLLVLRADPEDMHKLVEDAHLELAGKTDIKRGAKADRDSPEIVTVEAVITTRSPMIGRAPRQLRLRERYGVNLLAVRSGGQRPRTRLQDILLKEGDLVVLQGPAESINDTLGNLGALPLAERNLQLGRPRKVILPLLILAACVAASATEAVPAAIAFAAGAVAVGLFRVLSLQEIYDSIDWPILILLGALIPVGEALRTTGATDLVAAGLSGAAAHLPAFVTLGLLLAITMLLTPLLHHAAAVIVMGPVAASLAKHLGLAVDPFLMAVAVGAGSDFLSPIGHQCNTLVMGPGGYRFTDYWHLGLPLSILVVLCGVPLILLVWPLH
jgi:di/tricarboxylate transporter